MLVYFASKSKRCKQANSPFTLIYIITIHFLSIVCCNHEGVLIKQLLQDYSPEARPRENASEAILVTVDFFLSRIDELNLRKQSFTVTGWLYTEWNDDFLKWNPADYDNITKIVVPANRVWLPDISLGNSVDDIYKEAFFELFRVSVYSTGRVVWEPGGVFSTSCPTDITLYPFDHQTCELSFGNWMYTVDQVNLTNRSRVIGTENYALNGEWVVENTEVYAASFVYDCCPDLAYPEINFKLHIRRKFMYYFINIMIPCLMMSLLVLMVFYLPPDAGEKISLGVTVLLAFSVFQLMIAENMPASANTTPLLEIYLLCFMGASTFSVTVSVFVLNLHHRTEYTHPPKWVRKICLKWLAPWLCLGKTITNVVEPDAYIVDTAIHDTESQEGVEFRVDIQKENNPESHGYLTCPIIQVNEPTDHTNLTRGVSSPHVLSTHMAKSTVTLMKSMANFDTCKDVHSRKEFLSAVTDLYQEVCQTRLNDELGLALENEWKLIARVVDRCFFIVCTLLLIVSSGVIFGIMPYAHTEEQVFTRN